MSACSIEINKIYEADVNHFLSFIQDNSIDLVIADPPYNLKKGRWDDFNSDQEYFYFTFNWLHNLIPKLKDNSSLYIFNTPYNSAIICNYLNQTPLTFRNWITWYKKDGFSVSKRKYVNAQETILFYTLGNDYIFNYDDIRIEYTSKKRMEHAKKRGILKNGKRWYPNPAGKLCIDVWEFSSYRHNNKVNGKVVKSKHPTPKPEKLIERMILASSNENSTVLDLFSGTGTTSFLAKKLGRNFIGCELNKEFCQLIEQKGIKIGTL